MTLKKPAARKSAAKAIGPKGKREQTKAANRTAILEAARAVFVELGYGQTTVRDIIRGTGLASGTFYNYFRSKEEVFEALSDAAALQIRPRLREVRAKAKSLEEFLFETFRTYFEYVAHDHQAFTLMRRNAGQIRVRMDTPEIMAGFDELKSDVALAIASGLAPPVDLDYLTASLIGVAFEMAEQMLARKAPDPAAAARFATALILGGMPALPPVSR